MADAHSSPNHDQPSLGEGLFPELPSRTSSRKPQPGQILRPPAAASPIEIDTQLHEEVDAKTLDPSDVAQDVEDSELLDEAWGSSATAAPIDEAELIQEDGTETPAAADVQPRSALDELGSLVGNAKPKSPITPVDDMDIDDAPTTASSPLSALPPSLSPSVRPLPPSRRALPSPKLPPPAPQSAATVSRAPSLSAPAPIPPPAVKASSLAALSAAPSSTGPVPLVRAAEPSPASTIPPVAESLPPQRQETKKSSSAWLLVAAAVVGMGMLGGAFALLQKSGALAFASGGSGSVVVTAAGPGGKSVEGLKVYSDGALVCEASPCRLDNLQQGSHLVSVEADGYQKTAARAISVSKDQESAVHIELSPVSSATQAAAKESAETAQQEPQVKSDEAKGTLDLDKDDSVSKKTAPAPKSAKVATKSAANKVSSPTKAVATKPAAEAKPAAFGTLNINSIPRSNVVLDGRPLGMTPRLGIQVKPGPHSVIFIHPEHGRKSSGANVVAGKSHTVAVRFK